MDLKKSVLKVKLRLLKADGTSVAKDTNVALVNLPLQALFSEVECSLQQTPVAQMGSNYPFKAYIDTLLETGASDKVLLDSQLFERDSAGHLDEADVQAGANQGLYRRSLYTREGRILEMEGPLHLDVFRQHRLLLNGIPLTLKLWPSKNAFRLMSSDDNAAYRVQILDAAFKLCLQTPNAGVLMAHSKLLGDATAMYPFVTSHFKTASVSKGVYGFIENNLFQGDVPSQLIVALVSSEAFTVREFSADRRHRLVVLDDLMHQVVRDVDMELLFTQGCHHRRLSVLFLTQNLYVQGSRSRTIAFNTTYLVLMKNVRDISQVVTLGRQLYPGRWKILMKSFSDATSRDYGYLIVDLAPNSDDTYRLRTKVFPGEDTVIYIPQKV